MRFGFALPHAGAAANGPDISHFAQRAEALGFESIWSGLVLGARAETEIARANFNHERDWRIQPSAPVGKGIDRADVASMLLQLQAINELGR